MLILKALRKLFAIVLLALFGLSFASPLIAQAGMCDMKMPACCHKAAKQHCASMDKMDDMHAMDGMAMDGMDMDHDSASEAPAHHHISSRMNCCGCCGFMFGSAAHAVALFTPVLGIQVTPRSTRANLAPQQTSLLEATWQQSGNKRGPPVTPLRTA